ncbi:MAG: hypothetical protein HYW23_02265 [Candidatus Aenigmarchaeota archaeon]|nr:hypothetical protein [Candidatus Aenigmarchaeota archaeon]
MAEYRIREYQEIFQKLVSDLRKIDDAEFSYSISNSLLKRIVALKLEEAAAEGPVPIAYMPLADHAEAVVKGVKDGFRKVPDKQRIKTDFIVGTCYPGETDYYRGFVPSIYERIDDELKDYIRKGLSMPPVWIFALDYNGEKRGFVIDGHGRTSLTNCIGLKEIDVVIFP